MANKITQEEVVQKNLWENTIASTKNLIEQVDKLEAALSKVAAGAKESLGVSNVKDFEGLKKTNAEIEKINKAFRQKLQLEKERTTLINTTVKAEQKAEQERKKIRDKAASEEKKEQQDRLKRAEKLIATKKKEAAETVKAQKRVAREKEIADRKQEAAAKKTAAAEARATKEAQKSRKATIDNANAFKQLTKQTNSAQARFKRLAAQYGETDKRTQKALNTFQKLDTKLRSINQTARDGRRDVGRYGTAFSKLGTSLRNIATGLFIVQGIRAIGRAFADAFSRIKEFDSELQNIAGITGTTRDSLKDLEEAITFVSKSSIRTSTEVAKLATTLFTLGKTKEEVKLLLKPVNDLSIAFRVSSESAADFLGQTLNAFGRTAASAQLFADIIANVRTSTSLDFERIKDGLGFIAPTANALNLTLGETSALLGVLQDNGVRAARAGRLLNSSFARIIDKGLTLEEALDEINKSQNKVITSSELFGKEALALGLILADNTEKTADLANEFDNLSNGSLKDLTDKQLESLTSKLTILDSTWEALIFTVENGTGPISNFFKSAATGATSLINKLIFANQKFQENLGDNLKEFNKDFILDEEKKAQDVIKIRQDQLKADISNLKNEGLQNEEYDKRKKALQKDFDTFKKGLTDDEFERQRALYEDKLNSLTIKYYSDETIKEADFNAEKARLEKQFFEKTDDARTKSFRKTQERLIAQIDKFKGKSILPDVAVDLENPKKQLEEFLKFIDGKSSEIQSSFKIATEPTTAEKTAASLSGAFELAEEFNAEKARDKERRKVVSEKLKFLIEQQDKLRIINLLLQEQNDLEKVKPIPDGSGKTEVEETDEIIGLINNQAKVVADLRQEINASLIRGDDEGSILGLGKQLDAAEDELKRLKRIFTSTKEEFEKLQLDLIEDETERVIAKEKEKNDKLIEQIRSNAKVKGTVEERLTLEQAKAIDRIEANQAAFRLNEEIKRDTKQLELNSRFAEAEFDQRRSGFKTEEEFEKEKSAQIIAIKKKEIDEKIKLLTKAGREQDKIKIEELKADRAALFQFNEERIKAEVDVIAVLQALNEKYFSDKLDRISEEISETKKRGDQLFQLAATGNEKAAASLAQNQKDQAEAAKKKEDLIQKEKQFELALAIIASYNAEIKEGKTTSEALTSAITSTSVLTSVVAALPSFYEGTTDTGVGGKLDSNGGHLAVLHDNERVVDKKNNAKMGGVSNEDAATIVHDFNNDLLSYNTPQLTIKESRFDSNQQILTKFDSLEKSIVSAINDKETYLGSDIDTIKKMIIQNYSKAGTRTKVKSKYRTIK